MKPSVQVIKGELTGAVGGRQLVQQEIQELHPIKGRETFSHRGEFKYSFQETIFLFLRCFSMCMFRSKIHRRYFLSFSVLLCDHFFPLS